MFVLEGTMQAAEAQCTCNIIVFLFITNNSLEDNKASPEFVEK